jgi:membrane-associated phospholipid phosphatase
MSVRSSFPSMHCCIAVITMYYAWRFSDAFSTRFPRFFFRACVPLLISLVLSTVYLRHHWVPDCLAGMALGVVVLMLVPRLRRAWPQLSNASRSPG